MLRSCHHGRSSWCSLTLQHGESESESNETHRHQVEVGSEKSLTLISMRQTVAPDLAGQVRYGSYCYYSSRQTGAPDLTGQVRKWIIVSGNST